MPGQEIARHYELDGIWLEVSMVAHKVCAVQDRAVAMNYWVWDGKYAYPLT